MPYGSHIPFGMSNIAQWSEVSRLLDGNVVVDTSFQQDPLKVTADPFLLPEQCDLCPRMCGVNRRGGERGICGADGRMLIARAALHFWEEPPLSGQDGSGTVFFAHCPLRCIYCQNASISRSDAGRDVSVSELAEICLNLQEQGALNINMVTPTHYAPMIREAVSISRERGLQLPIVWNTSGYETVDAIHANDGTVDVYLSDFKYASSDLARRYSHAPDYPERALVATEAMVEAVGEPQFDEYHGQERMTKGVIVRHLLLPGSLDDSKKVVKLLWQNFGDSIRISLMNQYTPLLAQLAEKGNQWAQHEIARHPELSQAVPAEDYERLLDYADDLGVEDYYWQDGETDLTSFIPDFDEFGIS